MWLASLLWFAASAVLLLRLKTDGVGYTAIACGLWVYGCIGRCEGLLPNYLVSLDLEGLHTFLFEPLGDAPHLYHVVGVVTNVFSQH